MPERKTPFRRCIGCMTSFPKNEIVRIVAVDGTVAIDLSGNKNGRGAYLCRSLECFDMAVKKRRFSYSLGVTMTPEETASVREEFEKTVINAEVDL